MISALARRLFGAEYARLLYRLLAENAWPYRYHYAAALVLMGVVSAMFAGVALMMRDVFNDVFVSQNPDALRWLAIVLLLLFAVRGVAMFGQQVILARVGNRIVANLQKRIYDHMLRQGMVFHEENKTGDLAVRISQNCNAARMALNTLATRLGIDLTTVIGLVAVMFWNDVTMSLIALVGLPVILGGIALLVRKVRTQARAEVEVTARIISQVNETVLGGRIIKAFNLQDRMRERAGEAIEEGRDRADKLAFLSAFSAPVMEVMAGIGAALVLVYAGWRIIEGALMSARSSRFSSR